MPILADAKAPTRESALMGMFGKSTSITDGEWTLHQAPVAENQPLYWHGYHLARFIHYELGPYEDGRRAVEDGAAWPDPTSLHNKSEDPNEIVNLAAEESEQLVRMQDKLRDELLRLQAPPEQLMRLGLR